MSDFQFVNQPGELQGVNAFGQGGPPETGFYAVDVERMEATDKPHSGKMVLSVPAVPEFNQAAHAGEVWDWWNNAVPNPGGDKEIDRTNDLAKKGQVSTLLSLGYTMEQIAAGPVAHTWIIPYQGRKQRGYISYVAPELGAPKGSDLANPQVGWITRDAFLQAKASGAKPQRRTKRGDANPTAPVPPAPAGYAPPVPPPPPPASGYGHAPPTPPAPPAPPAPGAPPVAAPPAPPPPPAAGALPPMPPPPPPPPAR